MADTSMAPGAVWRAKSRFAAMDEIRVVADTENRRVLLVEWISDGRQLRMTTDVIQGDYTPAEPATGVGTRPRRHGPRRF